MLDENLCISSALSETVLKDFANSDTFEYSNTQGHVITSYGSPEVYIDDISVVSSRDEH